MPAAMEEKAVVFISGSDGFPIDLEDGSRKP
jgi:hypothetical protein